MAAAAAATPAPAAAADESDAGIATIPTHDRDFWSEGYKEVVARIDRVGPQITTFVKFTQERAALEKKFAGELVKLTKKWQGKINTMCDDLGDTTLRHALQAVVREPVHTAANHLAIDTELEENAAVMMRWRKEHYSTSFGKSVAAKEALKGFNKARAKFAKAAEEANKCKSNYYMKAQKVHDMQADIHRAHEISHEDSADGIKKLESKMHKMKTEADKARRHYEEAVKQTHTLAPDYEKAMLAEFDKCQKRESERIAAQHGFLGKYLGALDVDKGGRQRQVLADVTSSVNKINAVHDLTTYAHSLNIQEGTSPRHEFIEWSPSSTANLTLSTGEKSPAAWFTKAGDHTPSRSHRRFFVLQGKNFVYYATFSEGLPSKPKGVIHLQDATKLQISGKLLMITVKKRVWKLTSDNEEQAQKWAGMLAATTMLEPEVVPPPTMPPPVVPTTDDKKDDESGDEEAQANAVAYEAHHHAAATKIQAGFRGYKVRKEIQKQHEAAGKIQKHYRSYRTTKASAAAPAADASA